MKKTLFRLEDLQDGKCITVRIPDGKFDKEIFAVAQGDEFFVYENHCPHTGGPLDWLPDQFLNLDKTFIQCSTHHALFRIEDGVCVSGPCAGECLRAVNVTVYEGNVVIPEGE